MKTLLLLLATTSTLLGCFIPPAENVQLFRRDALEIDNNRQILLAKDLITLAKRPNTLDDTAQRRATAQLLALAANFAPNSKVPRNTAETLTAPLKNDLTTVEDYAEALENVSRVALYLLEDIQQKEHLAIAQLLLDPLATIAPHQGIVSARPTAEDSLRWHRAVAPLESFAARQQEPTPQTEEKAMIIDTPIITPEEPAEKPFKKVAAFEGSILVPAFLRQNSPEGGENKARIEILAFDAKLIKDFGKIEQPFEQHSKSSAKNLARITANLNRQYDAKVVEAIQGTFRSGTATYLDRNGSTLALPMTILAEGLLSERKPIDNLVVLGGLTESGAITSPKFPWQFLEILLASESNKPRRLLVSPEIKPLLVSFLTQQNEDFFFDFDIFAVSTLDEAYELAFQGSTPEKTTQALTKFQEIRQVGADKSTAAFIANPHVLARLAKVEEIEPRYLSATLLKIRSTSDHPQKHSTTALAAILQSAIMPLAGPSYSSFYNLTAETLESIHKQCRANLDPLARYITRSDRKMYDSALSLANRVRTLARAKSRDGNSSSSFSNTLRAIQEEHYELAKETATLLGQEPPIDPRFKKDN